MGVTIRGWLQRLFELVLLYGGLFFGDLGCLVAIRWSIESSSILLKTRLCLLINLGNGVVV